MPTRVLTVNTGSSSLRAALYHRDAVERVDLTATAARIGLPDGRLHVADRNGVTVLNEAGDVEDHDAALERLVAWLRHNRLGHDIHAVGHRVVFGGSKHRVPQLITAELIAALEELVAIEPDHLPQALNAIRSTHRHFPNIPQVACFDTAVHRQMPRVAQLYGLLRALADTTITRFGFHGLSYEYIMHELRIIDAGAATGRVIIAHLGNGASMAAVRGGVGIDT